MHARLLSVSRRSAPLGLALLATLVACGAEPKPPNVLIVSIDTLRADHLGCYGYPRATSPEIDAFAAGSVVFEQAHSSAPWTLPALASIHTGLFTATHGCDRIETRLDPEFETLAEILRNAGWDTAIVACHVFLGGAYGLQQGFTHVDEDMIAMAGDLDTSISSPGMTDRGFRFLESKARAADGVPWMLWLHYFDPHAEYLVHPGVSEPFGTVTELDRYDGEIAFTDRHVGRLLRGLSDLGLADETIVVLVADHGEEFGDHGDYRHGTNLYQEVIRVPLIIRAPGLPPGRVRDTVGSVDVFPTLLELCGVKSERRTAGHSLLPLTRGERMDPRELLLEVRWRDGQDLRGVRAEDWKYCEYRLRGVGSDLLYDLASDPLERVNLEPEDHEAAATMRARLARVQERALEEARAYPTPIRNAPAPADLEHLQNIGYVGEDGRAADEAPK